MQDPVLLKFDSAGLKVRLIQPLVINEKTWHTKIIFAFIAWLHSLENGIKAWGFQITTTTKLLHLQVQRVTFRVIYGQ